MWIVRGGPDEMTVFKNLLKQQGLRAGDVDNEELNIYKENMPCIEIFLACMMQWRLHPVTGQRISLDYPGLNAVMQMMQTENTLQMLFDIQVMERAALDQMNHGR